MPSTPETFGGVSSFAALAPEALGLFGNWVDSLSLHPALTEVASAAQLGLTLLSTVTAAQHNSGNVVAAIFDGVEAAAQAVGTVNQASSDDDD